MGACSSLLGHKFRPRFDCVPPDLSEVSMKGGAWGVNEMIGNLTKRTYVRDICERCGETIERATLRPAATNEGEGDGR